MKEVYTVRKYSGKKQIEVEVPGSKSITNRALMLAFEKIVIDTNISSQFVSSLLMARILLPKGLKIQMLGNRVKGAYIRTTLFMMEQFGIKVTQDGSVCTVPNGCHYSVETYNIEPDVSGACYFYAMAPLLGISVIVKNVHYNSIQGDIGTTNFRLHLELDIAFPIVHA